MIRLLYTFILLFSTAILLSSQNMEMLKKQITEAEETGEYSKINPLYKKLQIAYSQKKDWAKYAEQYLYIGQNYFFNFEEFEQLKHYADSALFFVQEREVPTDDAIYTLIWNHYGYYHNSTGDTKNAIKAFEKDLEISIKLASKENDYDREQLGEAYLNIGSQYSNLGDYDQAMDYYKRATEEFKKNSNLVAATYNNIAFDFQRKKEFRNSKIHYEKALRILEMLPNSQENSDTELRIYKSLVTLSNDQEKYDSAYFYLNQVKQRISSNEKLELAWYYTVFGGTDLFLKNFDSAKSNFQKGLKLYQRTLPNKHPLRSSCYKENGELYAEVNEQEKALFYFQKAMIALIPDFNDSLISVNPTLTNNISDKLELIQILDHKAKSLKSIENFSLSQSTLDLAIQLLDQIRFNYLAEGSKYALLEKAIPIYEQAISLALEMDNEAYAFELAERGKATILLENIKNTEAKAFAGISEELLEQEQDQKVQIAFYERLLNEAATTEDRVQYQQQVFDLKEDYQDFLTALETQHPDYYQLKYDIQYPSVEEVQQNLVGDQTALLEYFTGDSTIYAFVVTKGDLEVQRFPKTAEFAAQLEVMQKMVSDPESGTFIDYADGANQVYTSYVEPLLTQLPSTVKELIVIPDGQLSYVPFQALVKYPIQNTYQQARFDTLSYLVKDYAFSYAYSSTLLLKNQVAENTVVNGIAAFAPVFSERQMMAMRSSGLGALPFSEKEVNTIASLMNSQNFMNELASVETFQEEAPNFNILHLSTHAAVDDANPSQSKIYFHDNYITVGEIYNLPIQADLTVLSACETGIGEFKRGEGMLSLARAFMYAGCPSLVTSLWQVNDETTADLMVDFYTNLKSGSKKSEALHQAQLTYLDNVSSIQKTHPFYWAAFVPIGDQSALYSKGWSWYLIVGSLVVMLLAAFLLWRTTKAAKS